MPAKCHVIISKPRVIAEKEERSGKKLKRMNSGNISELVVGTIY